MNYLNYFIKCIIRQFTRLLFKPKYFFTIVIILLIVFLCLNSSVFAVYDGDDTYTDKNNTIFLAYNSIANDLINRFENSSEDVSGIKNFLKNPNYNYYLYYGNSNGSSLVSSSTWKTDILYIAIFSSSSAEVSSTIYDNYQGIGTDIKLVNTQHIYYFEGKELGSVSPTSVYMPAVLMTYKPENLVNYLNNNSSQQTQEIVGTIENESEKVQNTITSSTETVTNTLTDSTVNEETMQVDTTGMSLSDEQGIDNFFTNFLNMIHDLFKNIDATVEVITIPIPYTDNVITLRSDMISRHINDTFIYTLIQTFWWFIIGGYIIFFCKRMLDWLSTGKIAEKGVFSFIEWLDVNNEIIKSYMM